MEREIKFRAKTLDGDWVYGLLAHTRNSWYMSSIDGGSFGTGIDPKTIGQYIGFKDKNSVDIYEGDVVSCDQFQGLGWKVIGDVHIGVDIRQWSPADWGWCPDPRVYLDTRPYSKHNGSEFCIFHLNPEVLGNIHDGHTSKDVLERLKGV